MPIFQSLEINKLTGVLAGEMFLRKLNIDSSADSVTNASYSRGTIANNGVVEGDRPGVLLL
jgi:hypothetical protein